MEKAVLEGRPLEIPSSQKIDWTEEMGKVECWACETLIEAGQTAFFPNSHINPIHLDCIILLGE